MRFSLNGVFRLVVLVGAVVVVAAVGLSRLEPAESRHRAAAAAKYELLNAFVLNPRPDRSLVLDSETGALRTLSVPPGDQFEYGSCSPWVDERGDSQMVGRWMRRVGAGSVSGSRLEAFGLARYGVPSGRLIDQTTLDVLPASPPCWFPGTDARVIFSGGDGELYSVDLDASERGDDVKARQIGWKCKPPGEMLMVGDPFWATDPRLGGRLFVSLQHRTKRTDKMLTPSRLWWLSLSDDGLSVVAAGPLTDPEKGGGPGDQSEERSPSLAVTPDGDLLVAYLWQPKSMAQWSLRVAPVAFDAATGNPRVDADSVRTVHADHVPNAASFSPDGRWLYGIVRDVSGLSRIVRFSTAAPLAPAGVIVGTAPGATPRG